MMAATILVVDDEPEWRYLLRTIIERSGRKVVEASHGAAALERVAEERPDVVVTDLMMPLLSGRQLIQRLRSDRETASVPVVVVSVASRQAGEAILRKPFSPDELLRTVESVMATRG
jgi:CheY-like chemotaxis protein